MSVRTTFDENLDEVKDNLKVAQDSLWQCLNEDVWGKSNYAQSYIEKLHAIHLEIMKIRQKL